MMRLPKNVRYKIVAEESDLESEYIDLTIYFKSEFSSNWFDFRCHKKTKLVEISSPSFRYVTAFKNDRFKLLAHCTHMNQASLIKEIQKESMREASYEILPF